MKHFSLFSLVLENKSIFEIEILLRFTSVLQTPHWNAFCKCLKTTCFGAVFSLKNALQICFWGYYSHCPAHSCIFGERYRFLKRGKIFSFLWRIWLKIQICSKKIGFISLKFFQKVLYFFKHGGKFEWKCLFGWFFLNDIFKL